MRPIYAWLAGGCRIGAIDEWIAGGRGSLWDSP